MDKIKLWTILVPTVRNDGRFFSLKFHKAGDKKVKEISKGLTILSPSIGYWVSPTGQEFRERMIPVLIACTEEQINLISDFYAKYYSQEAMFFYLVSNEVFIINYDKNKKFKRV